jgi:hypothetical protein
MVLTGSSLIRSAEERERITRIYPQALCVDMESAVLMDSWHPLIIRGISDYADSHYDYDWVSYASATAAAVAKSIIQTLHTRSTRTESEHRPSFSSGTSGPQRTTSVCTDHGTPPHELAGTRDIPDHSISDSISVCSHTRNDRGADSTGRGEAVLRAGTELPETDPREKLLIQCAGDKSGRNTARALDLIRRGTKVTASNSSGNTALHYAVKHDKTDLTEALLAKDSSLVSQRNQEGETPLHRCTKNLTEPAAKHANLLIAAGKGRSWFVPDEKDGSGKTALEYTVANYPEKHCIGAFESLLDVGAFWTNAAKAKYSTYSEVYRRKCGAQAPK